MRTTSRGRGRTTRQAKAEQRKAWNQAIREGRMVNFGEVICPYNSPEAAQLACRTANEDGGEAFIVPPELAQD